MTLGARLIAPMIILLLFVPIELVKAEVITLTPETFSDKIAVAMNALYNGKKRHIRMRHKVIRSLIEAGVLSLEFVRSEKNIADPLTKGLCGRMVLDTAKEMGLKPFSS